MRMLKRLFIMGLVLGMVALTVSGCAPTMSGAVKDDTTLTGTSKELAKKGSDVDEYQGPKLRVGVVNFLNKTPSKVLGVEKPHRIS